MKMQFLMAGVILACGSLSAQVPQPPVVKTVPWVPGSPLIPHDTWDGKLITLKGACIPASGGTHEYTWDFGDGSPVVTANVPLSKPWVIGATHAYSTSGPNAVPVGGVITARLTVEDKSTGESASKPYYIIMRNKTLQAEINVAIDEGLWYLHRTQVRSGANGWWGGYVAVSAINVNAFEANGHREGGDMSNPYTETVAKGMHWCLGILDWRNISPYGSLDPDTNSNGIGIYVADNGRPGYQNGIYMDMLVASNTPGKVATAGGANVVGRTYFDIVQDMCDNYAHSQYDYGAAQGGWRYTANTHPDNSACQWAAIGLIAAERKWKCAVPDWVKTRNVIWLNYSQHSNGSYGYTGTGAHYSGFGTTPSGLVQCAMDAVGRGNPLWDKAETRTRDNWGSQLNNYYGLFAFVKSMQQHYQDGTNIPEPLTMLQSSTPGVPAIDWYEDPAVGVARNVVNRQYASGGSKGAWPQVGPFTNYGLNTARSILMLNPDVLGSGNPVGVVTANPNPAVGGQPIFLSATTSFHGSPGSSVVLFEWDLDNDGEFDDGNDPFATVSFTGVGEHTVRLRVTDDSLPPKTDVDTFIVLINEPPLPPTADAGGPYVLCPEVPKWFLDGTGSINPDEGVFATGTPGPGDTIQSYEWDLDGDGQFDDASGPQPEVRAFMEGLGVGSHIVQLQVTDTTATSFPNSVLGDLSDVAFATVEVKAEGTCGCVVDLVARAKSGKAQLTWTPNYNDEVDHYNIYRSTTQGGPYTKIGTTTSTYAAYTDYTVVNGTTYHYVVRGANALDQELCQSNEVSASPVARVRTPRPPRR